MSINISVPQEPATMLKPRITVIGVGGAGGNAVNNMIQSKLEGVDFVVANTDAQALTHAQTDRRIQLGSNTTQGLGAGARPEVGQAAAEEALDEILAELEGSNMVFITAGMGGGTGTGAAPVIAKAAREKGILTVGVVTKPFQFEGRHRMRLADQGIEDLSSHVDTLIIIPNQNLFRIADEKTTFADAFKMADDVLHSGVRSVTDLMVMPGLINLDFADVRTVMSEMGKAMMGTGEADGERRAIDAAERAISNPLLDDTSMAGAKGVLINISGGPDLTLFEVDEAANRIRDEVDHDANIIFGSCFNESLEGKMRVSVVATGIMPEGVQVVRPQRPAAPAFAGDITPYTQESSEPISIQPGSIPAWNTEKEELSREEEINDEPNITEEPVNLEETSSEAIPSMPEAEAFFADQRPEEEKPEIEEVVVENIVAANDEIEETVIEEPIPEEVEPVQKATQKDFFIPEAPVQPTQVSPEEPHLGLTETTKKEVAQKQENTTGINPGDNQDPSRTPTLFERVTGLGLVRLNKEEEQGTERAQPDLLNQTSTPSEEELEIPAFLRRQSN